MSAGDYDLIVIFLLVLLSFVLSGPVSFLSYWSVIIVVSVSLFIICFLCFWFLYYELLVHRNCCLPCKTIYKVSI